MQVSKVFFQGQMKKELRNDEIFAPAEIDKLEYEPGQICFAADSACDFESCVHGDW